MGDRIPGLNGETNDALGFGLTKDEKTKQLKAHKHHWYEPLNH
jgi:hypothetical protein